jgi:hypothetical protein
MINALLVQRKCILMEAAVNPVMKVAINVVKSQKIVYHAQRAIKTLQNCQARSAFLSLPSFHKDC